MKRLLKLIFILIVFFICFWLKNAVMWDAVYANNFRLSIKENREIKKVVLESIKDWNLAGYNADRDKLYQEEAPGYITYRADDYEKEAKYCVISHFFMKKMKIEYDSYYFIITGYCPEWCFYHIRVKKIDGVYKVISFGLDV